MFGPASPSNASHQHRGMIAAAVVGAGTLSAVTLAKHHHNSRKLEGRR